MAVLFSGCAGYSVIPSANTPQTCVIIKDGNFRYVKKVEGSWSATYILGLGDLSPQALANNSIGRMYENANLQDGQAIINMSTNTNIQCLFGYLIMIETSVTTGYVIEFTDGEHQEATSQSPVIRQEPKLSQNVEKEKQIVTEGFAVPAKALETHAEAVIPEEVISSDYRAFMRGEIYSMKKTNRTNIENNFVHEIESDLKNAEQAYELDRIERKIKYLEQYSLTNTHLESTVNRLKNQLQECRSKK